MKTLWVFGDSFSNPFIIESSHSWKSKYIEYKGYIPKIFGDIVSEKLGINYINKSPNSVDIQGLIDNITICLDDIKDGDIVSVGWPPTERFRLVNNDGFWQLYNAGSIRDDSMDFHTQMLVEICKNRLHPLYLEELNLRKKLIDRAFKNCRVIHWTWVNQKTLPCETIYLETGNTIMDHHWSEKGHQQFADYFIKVYNENISTDELFI
jgi:hypothetical protein